MNTRTTTFSAQPLPMSALLPSMTRLLLTQTSSVTRPTDPGNLVPEMLTVRATHITVVLHEVLEQRGYFHGGIND
jgi:hypothetical protein